MPSNEVKKKIEEIKRKKKEPMPTDEELKKKADQILCCVYILAKGEQVEIFENDVVKEVDKYYNTNYGSDLPRDVLQYLEDSGFIVWGEESADSISLTAQGIIFAKESSICDD